MTKVKAMKSFAKYLEENDIEYFDESDNEFGVPVYIIVCDAENTPDEFIEVNVVFYENMMLRYMEFMVRKE